MFALLATANGAGYRYGASDQAFYIPAVLRALNPAAYPRDSALIEGQARLILTDEVLAVLAQAATLPVEALFLAGYLLSLAAIWAGIVLIGSRLYASPWATIALGAAFTLRHRIPRTSANSFEPYFHPRMLAFGIGLLAIAALVRRRQWTAIILVAAAGLVHVTTAIWFGVLIGVALTVLDRRMRLPAAGAAAAAAAVAAWALTLGPLQSSLVRMDDLWLQAVASKDSLFPSEWPAWAWIANLALLPLLWGAYRWRASRTDQGGPEDRALVWGAAALAAVFLVSLPAVTARMAFPVQLQISRVFWLLDFLALVYVVAVVTSEPRAVDGAGSAPLAGRARALRRPVLVAALLVIVSLARGSYVMLVERPERALFETTLPRSAWEEAMQWVSRQPLDAHVLADPGHAWKYGTSVRVSGARDVFLEETKDSAIAIYSRDVAARVVERTAAIGSFEELSVERARDLARRYDLDYLIAVSPLSLPVAYRNEQFWIYALRAGASPGGRAAAAEPDTASPP